MKLVTPKDKEAILRVRKAGNYGGVYAGIVVDFVNKVQSGEDMLQEIVLDDNKITKNDIGKIRAGINKAVKRLDYEDDVVFFASNYRCFLLWQGKEPVLTDDPEQSGQRVEQQGD